MEEKTGKGPWLLRYLTAVAGWLACAFMGLALMVGLEARPEDWQSALYLVLLVLFANIVVFLFVTSRYSNSFSRHALAVLVVCIAEAVFFACMYYL